MIKLRETRNTTPAVEAGVKTFEQSSQLDSCSTLFQTKQLMNISNMELVCIN